MTISTILTPGPYRPAPGVSPDFPASAGAAFREKILAPDFPCVAAKAAVNTDVYRLGFYRDMDADSAPLADDLRTFAAEQPALDSDFTTFVAVFEDIGPPCEHAFEARLWALLAALRGHDTAPHAPDVSGDTTSPDFGFSFAGRAWFIVGLHPQASRMARRFPYPALAFNAHAQFRTLKADGRWPRMQAVIRERDRGLQGSINPNLADFGTASEARQYSGRAVEADWSAPRLSGCPLDQGSPGHTRGDAHD